MKIIILILICLLSCKNKEYKVEKIMNFLLADDLIIHELVNNELKPIGKCRKGEVIENVEYRTMNKEKIKENQKLNELILYYLKCSKDEGYYSFEEEDRYKYFKSEDFTYLKENKEKVFELYDYHKQMSGDFISASGENLLIELLGNIYDTNQKDYQTSLLFDYVNTKKLIVSKIKDYSYRLYNGDNDFIVTRDGKFITIEVKKGDTDVQKFHKKKFKEIIWKYPDYPDPD